MILPIPGATTVDAYFPEGSVWYNFYTMKVVSKGGETRTLPAPIDHIQANSPTQSHMPTLLFLYRYMFVEGALFLCRSQQ